MSRAQKAVIAFGLLAVVGFCLRPPYKLKNTAYIINRQTPLVHKTTTHITNIGHCWIWNPPRSGAKEVFPAGHVMMSSVATVDWLRLGVYVGLVVAVVLFLMFGVVGPRRSASRS